MKKKVLIGLSWPYANGRLHIGHVASSLPADVLARFHRSIGNDVSFVTGSDCYGTPILVQAAAEKMSPEDLADKYHKLFVQDFGLLGFTFDNYTKTMSSDHHKFVSQFHREMYTGDYIYEKTAPQLYCEKCNKYLPDRYVEGTCPYCKKEAKGDSCDHCGKMLEPEDLVDPKCKLCNGKPVVRDTTQLYLKLSALQPKIQKFFDERKSTWTQNAQGLTQRYLNEGLHDRAITRSIEWGIPVPREKWGDKRIYIWAENVLGYLSASKPEFIKEKENLLHYYVHAKDNIPFHSIILPGLIMANSKTEYHLPDMIVSSEYVTIEGHKISKSKGNVLTAEELLKVFNPDMIRYYFLRQAAAKSDLNFTFENFVNIINGELVNKFGNLVNRTLSLIKNKLDDGVALNPEYSLSGGKSYRINRAKTKINDFLSAGQVSRALDCAMDIVDYGNKMLDIDKPWYTVNKNPEKCKQDLSTIISIIHSATVLLEPFIPFACQKILKWFDSANKFADVEVLFPRLDPKEIKEKFERYIK